MSQAARPAPVYPLRTFAFRTPNLLLDFLLTAQEEAKFKRGSSLYEQSLNRLFLKKPQTLLVRVQTHRDDMTQLEQMAKSSGARIHEDDVVPDDAAELNIEQLLRMIRLKPAQADRRGASWLLALWETDANDLIQVASQLWNFGAAGVELAFLRRDADRQAPSHLIRVHGLRHLDALRSWQARHERSLEIYRRMGHGFSVTEYYVHADYQFPVPGVDRLLESNSKLVLIRPGRESGPPEWRSFDAQETRFFRKPHEVLDLQATFRDHPLIEVEAQDQVTRIPLSLALIPKPRAAVRQYWQIDQEIDRLRRSLRDLEQNRARLVGRDSDEVYFAYRFDQSADRELNPLLVRLLQQRLGTLSGYDHAFCKPQDGSPFHLVIANRPSRTLGFALQMADRIYYQPKQWRNWGVNLFLPMDTELAPLIDSNDAIPLLQRILEQTSQLADDESSTGDYREWDAILWESGGDGRIFETRVKEKQPLLAQFRLLNSFQCRVARDVEAKTRQQLALDLQTARAEITDDLREIERALLANVCSETDAIEKRFADMQTRLTKADQLVTQLQPQIDQVCGRLLKAPQDWVDFVREVIHLHRELSQPVFDEFSRVQNVVVQVQTTLLKTLTPRGKNLVEAARQELAHLQSQFQEFDQIKSGMVATLQELEQLGTRVEVVLVEVRRTYSQLEDRLRQLHDAEQQIETMQQEIEQIQQREAAVRERFEAVKQQRAAAETLAAETEKRRAEIQESEEKVARLTAELGKLKVELDRRGMLASARLQQLAQRVSKVREHTDAMEQLSRELHEQIGFVDQHAEAVTLWQNYRSSWETALLKKGHELSLTIAKMDQVLAQTKTRSEELDQLTQEIASVRSRVELITQQGNAHVSV